jgi:hypothetical protein
MRSLVKPKNPTIAFDDLSSRMSCLPPMSMPARGALRTR